MNKKKFDNVLWFLGLVVLIAFAIIVVATAAEASTLSDDLKGFQGTWEITFPVQENCNLLISMEILPDGNALAYMDGVGSVSMPEITVLQDGGPWKIFSFKVFEMVFKVMYYSPKKDYFRGVAYITYDLPYGLPTAAVDFVMVRK